LAVDARYRDKDGEISRKHGNTLVGRLRISYGSGFAQGCANDDKLSDVLAKLDERSLYKLVRDYKTGMLPIRLRIPWIIAPPCHKAGRAFRLSGNDSTLRTSVSIAPRMSLRKRTRPGLGIIEPCLPQ
jgi:hypothetical protein